MTQPVGVYDRDSYYDADGLASRLSPTLNGVLFTLDWLKAWAFIRRLRQLCGLRFKRTDSILPAVLDIGAGDGKFLYFIRDFGFRVFGTTASTISQGVAKTRFGVDLEFSLKVPSPTKAPPLQAITYWHVFEHLETPVEHVAAWGAILAPEGVVMVEVPNVESLGAKLAYTSWLGSDDRHHINHMTEKEIVELALAHGFVVVRHEGFSLKFTYPYLWSALLGRIFGRNRYTFERVFNILKDPYGRLISNPIITINALAAIVYLAPLIAVLTLYGLASGRGEVLRLYLKRNL